MKWYQCKLILSIHSKVSITTFNTLTHLHTFPLFIVTKYKKVSFTAVANFDLFKSLILFATFCRFSLSTTLSHLLYAVLPNPKGKRRATQFHAVAPSIQAKEFTSKTEQRYLFYAFFSLHLAPNIDHVPSLSPSKAFLLVGARWSNQSRYRLRKPSQPANRLWSVGRPGEEKV